MRAERMHTSGCLKAGASTLHLCLPFHAASTVWGRKPLHEPGLCVHSTSAVCNPDPDVLCAPVELSAVADQPSK
jgi:hypothetical protein